MEERKERKKEGRKEGRKGAHLIIKTNEFYEFIKLNVTLFLSFTLFSKVCRF